MFTRGSSEYAPARCSRLAHFACCDLTVVFLGGFDKNWHSSALRGAFTAPRNNFIWTEKWLQDQKKKKKKQGWLPRKYRRAGNLCRGATKPTSPGFCKTKRSRTSLLEADRSKCLVGFCGCLEAQIGKKMQHSDFEKAGSSFYLSGEVFTNAILAH